MAPPKKRANEPEPRPIIVKKIIAEAHGGHHGGAWKVAYADFVTAMMAFFLLMWLLGATTEKQRKSLADYFTPTLVTVKNNSAGSNGLMGGDSLTGKENYPTTGGQGNLAITIPRDSTGTKDVGGKDYKNRDRQKFEMMKKVLEQKLDQDNQLKRLKRNIRFRETNEGLRIDLVDEADFSMFGSGTDRLVPEARALLAQVAQVIAGETNDIIVRGSTDASRYGSDHMMNNWLLSAARAEATRVALSRSGVPASRFIRIEGVADRDPFIASSPFDPRNRRMAVILAWSRGASAAVDAQGDTPEEHAAIIKAIEARDNPRAKMARIAREADMGGTALPKGAIISNVDQISRKTIGAPSAKPAH